MPDPTSKYVVASKDCKNPEAAFKIVNYLIKYERDWIEQGLNTKTSSTDFYPLWNGYDNADEIEVSTETLEKYLAGEITMDDVDFSQHKLLKNDMEAVTELKKNHMMISVWINGIWTVILQNPIFRDWYHSWSEALRSYTIHMCLSIMPSAVRQKLWKQSGQI